MLRRLALLILLLFSAQAALAQSSPTPDGWNPDITFELSTRTPRRGEALRVTWDAPLAVAVRIETYDIYYWPRFQTKPPLFVADALPAAGSIDIPIPADVEGGGGWQIILSAQGPSDETLSQWRRIDVLFADVEQPLLLRFDEFSLPTGPLNRGNAVTLSWRSHPLVRGINDDGIVDYLPTTGHDETLFVEIVCIGDMTATPGLPLNARFDGLPQTYSMTWTVPDFPPWCSGILFNLGWDMNGEHVVFETRWVELWLLAPVQEAVYAAYQPFETGFMLWNSQNDEVRVFFDDGQAYVFSPHTSGGMVASPIDDPVPEGRFKPVNAFEIVWSNYYFPNGMLGWATAPEQGYTMTLTYEVGGAIMYTLPDGRTVRWFQSAWSWA